MVWLPPGVQFIRDFLRDTYSCPPGTKFPEETNHGAKKKITGPAVDVVQQRGVLPATNGQMQPPVQGSPEKEN
jgi:hypothetical protein